MYMPFFFDPTMIILLPAVAIAIYAQYKVKSAYNKYSDIKSKSGLTGADIAQKLLKNNNIICAYWDCRALEFALSDREPTGGYGNESHFTEMISNVTAVFRAPLYRSHSGAGDRRSRKTFGDRDER